MEVSSTWSLVVAIAATVGYTLYRQRKRTDLQNFKDGIVCCSNKNCVRCQRYRQVQKSAKSRCPWIVKDAHSIFPDQSLERVKRSIQNPTIARNTVQAPTVLMLKDLPSQAVVTKVHEGLRKMFQDDQVSSRILREVENVRDSMWLTNDSPKGTWKVLSFLNQGCWVFDVCKQCPEAFRFIEVLPNLMDECLFGNAMISKIAPGTLIEPHCGPTNIRHRLQMALQLPSERREMSLRVADSRLTWDREGDYFVFDDSFVHSVNFSKENGVNKRNGEERIVLIVDMWHPDLSPAERYVLQNVFPPASS